MERNIIIIRGLPGSGKSSLAKLFNTKAICCADDFITHNGIYSWKPETVHISHKWCQRKCERFMKIGAKLIIIANTNTTEKELKPYFNLADEFDYKIYSLILENRHGGVNVHDVPEETLIKMKNKFSIKL